MCVGLIQINDQDVPNPWHVPGDQLWAKAASASVVLGYYAVGCLFTAYQLGQQAKARAERIQIRSPNTEGIIFIIILSCSGIYQVYFEYLIGIGIKKV